MSTQVTRGRGRGRGRGFGLNSSVSQDITRAPKAAPPKAAPPPPPQRGQLVSSAPDTPSRKRSQTESTLKPDALKVNASFDNVPLSPSLPPIPPRKRNRAFSDPDTEDKFNDTIENQNTEEQSSLISAIISPRADVHNKNNYVPIQNPNQNQNQNQNEPEHDEYENENENENENEQEKEVNQTTAPPAAPTPTTQTGPTKSARRLRGGEKDKKRMTVMQQVLHFRAPLPHPLKKRRTRQNSKEKMPKERKKANSPVANEVECKNSNDDEWMTKEENPETQIFGLDVQIGFERGTEESKSLYIPLIVLSASNIIRNHITDVGIFRLSGGHARIQYWKKRFDLGDNPDLSEEPDPHVISGLLKLYLRELPESLLTKKLLPNFEASKALDDPHVKAMYINSLIDQLPEVNYCTLHWIMVLLIDIVSHAEENKMGIENLSLIFSPTLKCSVLIVQTMLESFDTIFTRAVN